MSSPPPKRSRTDDANTNGNSISNTEKQNEKASNGALLLEDTTNDNVINPSILHQSSELANSYANATPYPHGMIHNFCKDGFLGEYTAYLCDVTIFCSGGVFLSYTDRSAHLLHFSHHTPSPIYYATHLSRILFIICTEEILTELKHNTKVKFKETDLFRVYQSIDLVSIERGVYIFSY